MFQRAVRRLTGAPGGDTSPQASLQARGAREEAQRIFEALAEEGPLVQRMAEEIARSLGEGTGN